ncbi:molybdate ABC transporter substrate-binding protein [Pedobacter suwonensis]|uniref:molybdate ABC transporter substrate-binding protein n=1 Tax=Pedobacter suwonensis TaxID=332999 RepID=UPI0036899D72
MFLRIMILILLSFPLMVHAQSIGDTKLRYDLPWNKPWNNSLNFTVKGVDNLPDIYGEINDPQLVIFMGGNQFMVLDELIPAFKKKFPQYQRILIETLPPGLLFQQIEHGTLTIGNMQISVKPDIYTAGADKIEQNMKMFSRAEAFTSTKLALMVAKGNPKKINGFLDLQRKDLRISMPDKKIEGIGRTIEDAYLKAGGDAMHQRIMVEKVAEGTTFITQIHHRQSPMRILNADSDVAPVWETEILYQQKLGHLVESITIPDEYNKVSVTKAGLLKSAPHRQAAQDFLDFLTGEESQQIFQKFGFGPANK